MNIGQSFIKKFSNGGEIPGPYAPGTDWTDPANFELYNYLAGLDPEQFAAAMQSNFGMVTGMMEDDAETPIVYDDEGNYVSGDESLNPLDYSMLFQQYDDTAQASLRDTYTSAMGKSEGKARNTLADAYRMSRVGMTRAANAANAVASGAGIGRWQLSIGSKSYREINGDTATNLEDCNFEESECMWRKVMKSYDGYQGNDEFKPSVRNMHIAQTGLDLDFSPDAGVLSAETTLNNNDIRLRLVGRRCTNVPADVKFRVYVMSKYQCALSVYPGNEVRMLET